MRQLDDSYGNPRPDFDQVFQHHGGRPVARTVLNAHRAFTKTRRCNCSAEVAQPHMTLVSTGTGRAVPRTVPRRGSVVHREMVEKVPSGLEEKELV